jgi:NADH:ubiquinone oxidoreductase subunit E
MAESIKSSNVIKVCQGPGCRAWGAQGLIRRIKALSEGVSEKPRVCSSACMNRCGGGTSVEVVSRQTFVKIKNSPEQLQSMLCSQPVMS